jgi:hypothetical protein
VGPDISISKYICVGGFSASSSLSGAQFGQSIRGERIAETALQSLFPLYLIICTIALACIIAQIWHFLPKFDFRKFRISNSVSGAVTDGMCVIPTSAGTLQTLEDSGAVRCSLVSARGIVQFSATLSAVFFFRKFPQHLQIGRHPSPCCGNFAVKAYGYLSTLTFDTLCVWSLQNWRLQPNQTPSTPAGKYWFGLVLTRRNIHDWAI